MTKKISNVKYKTVICAFCKGRGKDPFGVLSKLSNCQVCVGKGEVRIIVPTETCPYCKGKGIFFQHRLPCSVCGGKGAVTKIRGEKRCSKCEESGFNPESKLPCSSCYGLGSF